MRYGSEERRRATVRTAADVDVEALVLGVELGLPDALVLPAAMAREMPLTEKPRGVSRVA